MMGCGLHETVRLRRSIMMRITLWHIRVKRLGFSFLLFRRVIKL